MSTRNPETRDEFVSAIASLRARGLASASTLGVDLRALSLDELRALHAKALRDRSEVEAAHASAEARAHARWHATHQSHEQVLARSRPRVRATLEPEPPMAA